MDEELIDRIIEAGEFQMPPDLSERYKIYMRERFTWFGQEPEPPEVNSPRGKVLIEATHAWADQLPEPDRKRVYKALIKALFSASWEDMIEKGELVPVGNDRVKLREDATPAELAAAGLPAGLPKRRRVRR